MQTFSTNYKTSIFIIIFSLIFFYIIEQAGVQGEVFQQFALLCLSWILLMFWPVWLFVIKKFPSISPYFLAFIKDTPLLFAAFFAAGGIHSFLGQSGEINPFFLYASFFFIVLIADNLFVLFEVLSSFNLVKKIIGEKVLKKVNDINALEGEEQFLAKQSFGVFFALTVGVGLVFFFAFISVLVVKITGVKNHPAMFLILPPLLLMLIGMLRFCYITLFNKFFYSKKIF